MKLFSRALLPRSSLLLRSQPPLSRPQTSPLPHSFSPSFSLFPRFASSLPENILYAHHEVVATNRGIWKEYHDADYKAMGDLLKHAPKTELDPSSMKTLQNAIENFTQTPTPEVIESLQDVFHVYCNPETTLLHEEGLRALLIEKEKCWEPDNNLAKAGMDVTKGIMLQNITAMAKQKSPDVPESTLSLFTKSLSEVWDESYSECLPEVDKARSAFFIRTFDHGETLEPYGILLSLGGKEQSGEFGVDVDDFVKNFRTVYVKEVSNKLLGAPEYKGLDSLVEKKVGDRLSRLFGM